MSEGEAQSSSTATTAPATSSDVTTDSTLRLEDIVVERGGRAVVRGVSIEITPGEVTALLGPNGAGKSSLVLAAGGVLRPASGSITLGGENLTGRRPERIRQAGVAIEYGSVTIEGHKSYICPVHSLALSVAESSGEGGYRSRVFTRINEVTFSGYHRFGSTIRVVGPADQP